MDWKDLKLRQFERLNEIAKDDQINEEDRGILTLAVINGLGEDEIYDYTLNDFRRLEKADFLKTEIKRISFPGKYVLNGRKYNLISDLKSFTVAQYIDFQTFMKKGSSPSQTLTVFIIPEGHTYNDGYDMAQVMEDLRDMDMVSVHSISAFFLTSFAALTKAILLSTERRLRKMSKTEKEKAKAEIWKLMKVASAGCH